MEDLFYFGGLMVRAGPSNRALDLITLPELMSPIQAPGCEIKLSCACTWKFFSSLFGVKSLSVER